LFSLCSKVSLLSGERSLDEKVLVMPYRTVPTRLIVRLIGAGYLNPEKRCDVDAIEAAPDRPKFARLDIFSHPESGDEPPAPAG
jgi:hypothetical protein